MASPPLFEAFFRELAVEGIAVGVEEYRRMRLVFGTERAWTLEEIRETLSVLVVKQPRQRSIVLSRFDNFFVAGSEELDVEIDFQRAFDDFLRLKKAKREMDAARDALVEFPDRSNEEIFDSPPRNWRWLSVTIGVAAVVLLVILLLPRPKASGELSFRNLSVASPQLKPGETITNRFEIGNSNRVDLSYELEVVVPPFVRASLTSSNAIVTAESTNRVELVAELEIATNATVEVRIRSADFLRSSMVALQGMTPTKPDQQSKVQNPLLPGGDSQRIKMETRELEIPRGGVIWFLLAGLCWLALVLYGTYLCYWQKTPRPKPPQPNYDDEASWLFAPEKVGGAAPPRMEEGALRTSSEMVGYFTGEELSDRLHLSRTLRATVRNGGIPSPLFEPLLLGRSVIILEDDFSLTELRNSLPRELAHGMERRNVPVLRGWFRGDPERFHDERGMERGLAEFDQDKEGHVVLLFTDGYSFRGRRSRGLEELARWPCRVWMHWGDLQTLERHSELARHHGLRIHPATSAGILAAFEGLILDRCQSGGDCELSAPEANPVRLGWKGYLEQRLGDALYWAAACSLLQPCGAGLAERLREQHFPHLATEDFDRLRRLRDVTLRDEAIEFATEATAALRRIWYQQTTAEEQQPVFATLQRCVEESRPRQVRDSPAVLAWEVQRELLAMEADSNHSLIRLAALSQSDLGRSVRSVLRNRCAPHAEEEDCIPLRHLPTSERDRQLLARMWQDTGKAVVGLVVKNELPIEPRQSIVLALLCIGFAVSFWFGWQTRPAVRTNAGYWSVESHDAGVWRLSGGTNGSGFDLRWGEAWRTNTPVPEKGKYQVSYSPSGETVVAATNFSVLSTPFLQHRFAVVAEGERSVSMELIRISAGEFLVGEKGSKTKVFITNEFYLGRTEVTQRQYTALMGTNTSYSGNLHPDAPVDSVTWDDAVAFCRRLTDYERQWGRLPKAWEYRLPTEAQWVYAAQAGTNPELLKEMPNPDLVTTSTMISRKMHIVEDGEYPAKIARRYGVALEALLKANPGTNPRKWDIGDKIRIPELEYSLVVDPAELRRFAWFEDNSDGKSHPAGTKQANPWGFEDMYGNVWEWCSASAGQLRLFRGGGWSNQAVVCRSESRIDFQGGFQAQDLGFRVAVVQSRESAPEGGGREKLQMVLIKAGTFLMGSPNSEVGRYPEETLHQVTLTHDFYLSQYEITQGQYASLMGTNPASSKQLGPNAPVENVSWYEAIEFCRRLTELQRTARKLPEGYVYTLPTEAQWEYACRAGSTNRFQFGDDSSRLGEFAWYGDNAGGEMHMVGQKEPNDWGLYDMHGNVREWCRDWLAAYDKWSDTDPTGPEMGQFRATRGGTWGSSVGDCRSAYRFANEPFVKQSGLGFRVAAVQSIKAKSEVWGREPQMVLIEAGTFMMGSPTNEMGRTHDEILHQVTLTRDFYLSRHEITQGQYESVMGTNPAAFKELGSIAPVESVSWIDAMEYCRRLTDLHRNERKLPRGYVYTLPTEAQWEYACRAGSTNRFYFGDQESRLGEFAWYGKPFAGSTHPVGQKNPNGYGLFDMHGNVWEWCRDEFRDLSAHPVVDPVGLDGTRWVIRGGSWSSSAASCRSAVRAKSPPVYVGPYFGFRVAAVLNPEIQRDGQVQNPK